MGRENFIWGDLAFYGGIWKPLRNHEWSKVGRGAVNSLVNRFALEEEAVREKFVWYFIKVAIFMGLREHRLEEILKSSYGGQRDETIFYGGCWPLKTPCKEFDLAIGGRLGWVKWFKNGVGKAFIFHAVTLALYPFWWKFYWLSQGTFIFSRLESQSRKNKIATNLWRLKIWWYLSKLLTITIITLILN